MALAKYKRTKSGSSFRDQTSSGDIPSVQRGQSSREIRKMQTLSTQKANRDEQSFVQNLRLGLNQGKMSEVSYYNSLVDFYDKKLSTTGDPLEQVKLQNKIYTYMDAAKNASESAGRKAEAAASKVANAEYREVKAAIRDIKTDIFLGKLQNGGYDNPSQFVDDLNKLYKLETESLNEVANNDSFSDATRQAAVDRLGEMEEQYSNPRGTGDYGGLKYKTDNKDTFVFTQQQGGQFPGGIELEFHPELQGVSQSGDWIQGEDKIWRKAQPLGKKDELTGEILFTNPETGREERVGPDDPRWQQYLDRRAITVYDPFDPTKSKTWLSPKGDNKWELVGSNGEVKADAPSFNPKYEAFSTRAPFTPDRTNLSTTPFIAGGSAFGATGFDQAGMPAFNDGQQPKTPFQLSQEEPSLLNVEFKQPKYERKKLPTGKYDFLKDGKSTSLEDYMKGTGMNREDAVRGEDDIRKSPLSVLQNAGKAASQGYRGFKSFFQSLYG